MYNAFISYSHIADTELADALEKGILRYALPWYSKSKLNLFRDQSSLSVNPHLWDNIKKALLASEHLIYMASSQSANSEWVGKELEFWLQNKSLDNLIIVITKGELNWDNNNKTFKEIKDNCIHNSLFTVFKQEPFYIDLRQLKSEDDLSLKNSIFNKEVLKIVAALYGKAQKEIAGDEVKTQKRVKQFTLIIITMLLGAFLTTFYFFKDSQKSQEEAETAEENVSNLLKIALQGRGEQYENKELDSIIERLEYERVRPLKELIVPKATRTKVGQTDNYDYLIWIDVPSFRADSIINVNYTWPKDSKVFSRGSRYVSSQASTGFAFGYRGILAIPKYITVNVSLKGGREIKERFYINKYLNELYGLQGIHRIREK